MKKFNLLFAVLLLLSISCNKEESFKQIPNEKDAYFQMLREDIEQRFFEYNGVTTINPYLIKMDMYEGDIVTKSADELYSPFIEEVRQFYQDNKNIRKQIEKKVGYPLWDKLQEMNVDGGKLAIIPVAHSKSEFVECLIFIYKGTNDEKLKFHYAIRNKFNKYPDKVEYSANGKKKFDRLFIISEFMVFDKLIFGKADCNLVDQLKELVGSSENNLKDLYCDYTITITDYYWVTIAGNYITVEYVRSEYEFEFNCIETGGGGSYSGGGGGTTGEGAGPEAILEELPDIEGAEITQNKIWEADDTKPYPCEGAVTSNMAIAATAIGNPLVSGTFDYLRTRTDGTTYLHKGLDIAGTIGDPIYAPFDGVVIHASNNNDFNNGLGNYICIESMVNGKKIRTFLAHCSNVFPIDGNIVHAGAIIANIGTTGNADGVDYPHVHVAIQEWIGSYWSEYKNPLNYLTTQYDSNWTSTPCTQNN